MSSLYLHIPFCHSRCYYCDFYSQVGNSEQLNEYVDLLRADLQQLSKQQPAAATVETIFFGGGTPSLLSAKQVDLLLQQIKDGFGCAPGCEISLEANPGTLDADKLQGYRVAGVNRLSLGVQSLSDSRLQQLGRRHAADDVPRSVELARAAGFDNLSLDLIFSLPGQTEPELQADLEGLLDLQPQHLSLYGLSFEPGTELTARLTRDELSENSDAAYADQYRLLANLLTAAGFEHYEISNFALPGYRCQHNQIYWQRKTCLAVGSGAHSFAAEGWGERQQRPDLNCYRSRLSGGEDPAERLEGFDRQGAMAETVYLALRTADGLSRNQFRQQFGLFPEDAFPAAFKQLERQLRLKEGCWYFDLNAWLLYDHLISAFL